MGTRTAGAIISVGHEAQEFSALAARDPVSRVGAREDRGFEEVIRIWTLRILSGVEGD